MRDAKRGKGIEIVRVAGEFGFAESDGLIETIFEALLVFRGDLHLRSAEEGIVARYELAF